MWTDWIGTCRPTLKQILAVRCPMCGAKAGEQCELHSGQARTSPHRDRRLVAEDLLHEFKNKGLARICGY